MLNAALRWGAIMGCESCLVRTVRADANGLAEPRAWERLGFKFDSALLRGPMTRREYQTPTEELPSEEVEPDDDA